MVSEDGHISSHASTECISRVDSASGSSDKCTSASKVHPSLRQSSAISRFRDGEALSHWNRNPLCCGNPSTENMPPRYTALQIEQSDLGRRCSRWISMCRVAPSNASCCDVRRGYSWLPALYHGCLHTGQTASRCPLLSSVGMASCCKSWCKRTA